MKSSLLFLFLICSSFIVQAQSKAPSEKTLLWRISGRGLTQPSYLFGTMHLTDERLFNFSDSLLGAIQNSQGFAMEVDPDEMMTVMMEEMFNDIKKTQPLKEVVSRKAFSKYAPLLSKRMKKPQEDLTVKDVMQEQNKWMRDAYKKGTMPTFVDTWLYDIARRQGKWVGGIEDVEDQKGLLENLFTEQDLEFLTADYSTLGKAFLNNMIDTYAKQDLGGIEQISNMGDAHRKDMLLLKRNVKMARRMDSLSALRTMVFAVGAAHLPGDSGVISLLRQKGFDVQPVFGSKTIAGKNYKVDAKPIAWKKFTDGNELYEVEMPGKASPLKMYGVLEMRMNIDLFSSSGYLTMALPSSLGVNNPDSALLELGRKMMQNEKLKQGKPIILNGIKGREYISHGDDGYKRAQIFTNGQIVYVACAFFTKEEGLEGEDVKHFFTSLKLFEATGKPDNWISFAGVCPGLEGYAPVALEVNKQMANQAKEEGWETKAFTGMDVKTGSFYMLISRSTLNDMYIPDDSAYLKLIRNNSQLKGEKFDLDTIVLSDGNYLLEQRGIYKENGLRFHMKSAVKGNCAYTLFVFMEDKKENETLAEKAIKTFKLVDPPSPVWAVHQTATGRFKTWTPGQLIMHVDTTENAENKTASFNVRDSASSYLYSVVKMPFDTGYWHNGEENYWKDKLKDYETETDTVLSSLPFKTNELHGYDLQVRKKSSEHKIKLMRLFLYGDTLYTLISCVPTAYKSNPDVQRFFSEFGFSYPQPAVTIFTSKAPAYLRRLSSSDSASRASALNGFYSASFNKDDIPALRQALLPHYDWDSTNYYRFVQVSIGEKLNTLNDSTLDEFVKANYANTNGRDDEEQTALLSLVAEQPSIANLRFVTDALKQVDASSVIYDNVLYRLDDSLPLIASVLPDVLSLIEKKNMTDAMLDLSKRLLDSNLVQPATLKPYEAAILSFGKEKLQQVNGEKEDDDYSLRSVAFVAGRLKTPESIGLLQSMVLSKHNGVKLQGVMGLLQAGEPLPASTLTSIASDRSLRNDLMETLKSSKKEMLFPKSFLSQQAFAEAAIYDYLSEDADDYEITYPITFSGMQKEVLNGKQYNLYFFKTSSDNKKEQNLAVAAFPLDIKNFEAIEYGTAVNWEDTVTSKNKDEQVKALIDTLKENMKEE